MGRCVGLRRSPLRVAAGTVPARRRGRRASRTTRMGIAPRPGRRDYSWNVAGELATSNTPSGSYRYDPEGLRVGMILGTGWRRYSWDDTSGAPELISDNRAGGETFCYVYGPDGMPCEQLDTNGGTTTVAWLHRDATGSVRLSTDSAGNQTSTQSYDPWGNVTATTGTPAQLGLRLRTGRPDRADLPPSPLLRPDNRTIPHPGPRFHRHPVRLRLHRQRPGQRLRPHRADLR